MVFVKDNHSSASSASFRRQFSQKEYNLFTTSPPWMTSQNFNLFKNIEYYKECLSKVNFPRILNLGVVGSMSTKDENELIEDLLEKRTKFEKRLKRLEEEYKKEKGNGDAWPGHDTNFLLQIQQDELLLHSLLADIQKALKDLGYDDP